MSSILKLSEMNRRGKARIICFDQNPEICSRLNNLGLSNGSVVEVLAGSDTSNYLISTGNTRVGIEPNIAEAITVQMM